MSARPPGAAAPPPAPPPAPSRDELVRDGIPPALLEYHRARAAVLRAEALARFGRDLARRLGALRRPPAPAPRDALV